MPDPYASIADQLVAVQEVLANAIETRAADPQFTSIVTAYLATLPLKPGTRAIELGCGTGAVTRILAQWPDISSAHGVDPSGVFIKTAKRLSAALPSVSFEQGDARALPLPDGSFDLVVIHTTLCHMPEPERAIGEAFRLLRPGGWIAVCDGDYGLASVALSPDDPLQSTVRVMFQNFVNDLWLVRRLPAILQQAGFGEPKAIGHGFLQTSYPAYLLTVIGRGADLMANGGIIGSELAEALKNEARQRVEQGRFYGTVPFVTFSAQRPG